MTQAALTAKGPLSALEATLSATGPDLKAQTEAEIAQIAAGYRVTVRSLAADVKGIEVKSRKPALITLENGMRFLTDYLQGDVYFRTSRPGQNLDRTRTQLGMVAAMDAATSDHPAGKEATDASAS